MTDSKDEDPNLTPVRNGTGVTRRTPRQWHPRLCALTPLRGILCSPRALACLALAILLLPGRASISQQTSGAKQQESQPQLTPAEIKLYEQARTLLEWTPKEVRARRELHGLHLAEDQGNLATVLMQAGEPVASQMARFRDTACLETIQSETCRAEAGLRILPGGIPQEYDGQSMSCTTFFTGQFRYLWLLHERKGGRTLEEYRTDIQGKAIDLSDPTNRLPLLTWGFSSAALYFHPLNQPACRFRYFGTQMLKGRPTDVVGFAPLPKANAPAITMRLGSVHAQLLEQGLAWIDAATHEILRIQTSLLAPRRDVRVDNETTEIDFASVHLAEVPAPLRLPTKVVVDIESYHRYLRNTHTYSGFKMFRVESRIVAMPPN